MTDVHELKRLLKKLDVFLKLLRRSTQEEVIHIDEDDCCNNIRWESLSAKTQDSLWGTQVHGLWGFHEAALVNLKAHLRGPTMYYSNTKHDFWRPNRTGLFWWIYWCNQKWSNAEPMSFTQITLWWVWTSKVNLKAVAWGAETQILSGWRVLREINWTRFQTHLVLRTFLSPSDVRSLIGTPVCRSFPWLMSWRSSFDLLIWKPRKHVGYHPWS